MNETIYRDERTEVVENASYRLAYLVLSYGLLVSVAYRALISGQSSWDLLVLVVLGGGIATLYQGKHEVLTPRWKMASAVTVLIAMIMAVVIAVLFRD